MAKDDEPREGAVDESGFYDPAGKEEPVTPADEPGKAKDGDAPDNVRQLPGANGGREGKPLEEAADDPDEPETDADGQLVFQTYEEGKKVTLGNLVQRGTPVSYRFAMTGKSVPSIQGGLIDPYSTSVPLIADCVVDADKVQYIRGENQKVKEVIVYMTLKPRQVADLRTEQGQVWLAEMMKAVDAA